jgi:hypothetical protein
MTNVIALCVGFCGVVGVVLFTDLLRSGALGSGAYSTLIAVTVLAALAISRIDLLQVLDLKNLRMTLRQIEEARADVHAKAESVRRWAKSSPNSSCSTSGRWVD